MVDGLNPDNTTGLLAGAALIQDAVFTGRYRINRVLAEGIGLCTNQSMVAPVLLMFVAGWATGAGQELICACAVSMPNSAKANARKCLSDFMEIEFRVGS